MRHHQAGRLGEAERAYRAVLAHRPDDPEALHLLGVLAAQAGKPEVAVDCIGRAVRADGRNPTFHYNLGLAYQRLGDRPAAIGSYRRAVALQADYADALSNLAGLLLEDEAVEEAIAHYRQVVRLRPDDALAHMNLGTALLGRNALEEAEACFREAVRLEPSFAQAHNGLGAAVLFQNRHAEAATALSEALRLKPDPAHAHNNLGLALMGQGRFHGAVDSFREALRLAPDDVHTYNNLGLACFSLDWLDEAEAAYREALARKPDAGEVRANLADLLIERNEADAALAICKDLLNLEPTSEAALAAKASTLERTGRLDEAFAIVGPRVAAGTTHPGIASVFGAIAPRFGRREEAIALLERVLVERRLAPVDRRRVHFTLGALYDGRDAFDEAFGHYAEGNALRPTPFDPDAVAATVAAVIEFFSAERLAGLPRAGGDSELPVFIVGMPRSGTTLVEQILDSHPAVFGAGELRDVGALARLLGSHPRALRDEPERFAAVGRAALDDAAARHLERLQRLAGGAVRVTDKMPPNVNHLGLIALLFPRARIIHCVRDPMDTCLSNYFQNFRRGNFHAFDLGHCGAFYVQYARLMRHWRAVLDVPLLEVRYEELVADVEAVSRRMVAFLGLDWDPACLTFHESGRVTRTASYDQVRRPIYQRSVGRWRHYERHLGPLKAALGDLA